MKNYFLIFCMFSMFTFSCNKVEETNDGEDWIIALFDQLKAEYKVPESVHIVDIDPASYSGEISRDSIEKSMRAQLQWFAENHKDLHEWVEDQNEKSWTLAQEKREALSKVHTTRDTFLTLLKFPDEAAIIPQDILDHLGIEIERVPIDTSALR